MSRLFVALPVPGMIKQPLRQAQQLCPPNCRLVKPVAWHITLQFIGNGEIETVDACLETIKAAPFELGLAKPGYFGRLKRGVALWWGVEPANALLDLQQSIHQQLRGGLGGKYIGEEKGVYTPHITLARCKPCSRAMVEPFLQQAMSVDTRFWCESFALYSSVTDSAGARYTLEKAYPLKSVA